MRRAPSQLKDALFGLSSAVVGRGCYVVLQVVLARHLGPRDYGLYAIGWTVISLVSTFAALGMPQAMLRFGIAGRTSLYSLPMMVAAVTAVALAAGMLTSANFVAVRVFGEPDAAPIIRAFALTVPLLALLAASSAALRASGAMLASSAVGGLLFAFYLVATALVFLIAPSATSAAHMYTVSAFASLVLAAALLAPHRSAWSAARAGAIIRFGVVTMFIHSANVLNLLADRVVIGIMSDAEAVGIYQVASQLAAVMIVLRGAVTIVFEAAAAKISARVDEVPDVTRPYFGSARILLHATAAGLVVLAITASFWIQLLFGVAFAAAAPALVILVLGQLATAFAGPSVTALHMTGKERLLLTLTMASCLLNIVGNVLLIPVVGLAGAALTSASANVAIAVVSLLALRRTGRLCFSWHWLNDVVLGTLTCAVSTLCLVMALGELSIVTAGLVLATAYLVYFTVVYLTCSVEDEVILFARNALRRRPGLLP